MWIALVKATIGIVAVVAVWAGIDIAWRRMFPDRPHHKGCGGCTSCAKPCDDRK